MKPTIVKDLLSFVVKSVAEIEHVMNVGNQNRSVGATNMNEHSSRSHAIFTIYIECSRKVRISDEWADFGPVFPSQKIWLKY